MQRWLRFAMVTAILLLVASTVSAQVQYRIRVNGREVASDPPPQNIEGRLFVPLRAVSEALGAKVDYDDATSTAIISTQTSATTDARIDELTRLTQSQAVQLSTPARDTIPFVQVSSAYLSIKIDMLQGANLDSLVLAMRDGIFDRYDGIHIIASDALVTIHGSDIQSWRSGKLSDTAFVDRWAISSGGNTRSAPTTLPSPPSNDVIESKIDGTFEGWTGDTLFVLTNGQIWKQSSYAYTYHYAYMPKVLIYRSGSVWKMKVDGVSSEITVTRLK